MKITNEQFEIDHVKRSLRRLESRAEYQPSKTITDIFLGAVTILVTANVLSILIG
tara:strand:+ start:1216 stop:1380 length:165 start_codon:yes stop_codon:yes gene_type:complete